MFCSYWVSIIHFINPLLSDLFLFLFFLSVIIFFLSFCLRNLSLSAVLTLILLLIKDYLNCSLHCLFHPICSRHPSLFFHFLSFLHIFMHSFCWGPCRVIPAVSSSYFKSSCKPANNFFFFFFITFSLLNFFFLADDWRRTFCQV